MFKNVNLYRVGYVLALVSAFYFPFGGLVFAAISYDTSALAVGDSVSSKTVSYAAGSDVSIVVGCAVPATFTVDSVTFAGNSFSQISHQSILGSTFSELYLFEIDHQSGTNDIVITASGSTFLYCAISSYAGVGGVDTSNQNASVVNPLTTSLTTSIDNDWLVFFSARGNSADTFTEGANTLIREVEGSEWIAQGDSDSDQTPAGVHSQTVTFSNSGLAGMQVLALYPSGSTPPSPSVASSTLNCVHDASSSDCLVQITDDPNRDFFNGIILFVIGMIFMIWLTTKR